MKRRISTATCLVLMGLFLASCSALSGDTVIDEGVVIAPKLKIRSTTAAVALDVGEVKRGDRLEILDQAEVKTPTRVEEWYKVRTRSSDRLTGWVESRYIISQTLVKKTEDLFDKTKDITSQGTGRLKVQTKLRIEPGGDVVTLLSKGMNVEVVNKARTTVKLEKQQNSDDTDETSEEPEARTVLWMQVRLPDTEVLRTGWVGAQQVDMDVPEEILHLEGEGRRFTGWVVFDQTRDKKGELKNNYIGLMKSLDTQAPVDFTRIWVLVFDPNTGRYNGPYIEDGLRGLLPVRLGDVQGRKGFTIQELNENGKQFTVEYELTRIDPSHVRVKRLTQKFFTKKPPRK